MNFLPVPNGIHDVENSSVGKDTLVVVIERVDKTWLKNMKRLTENRPDKICRYGETVQNICGIKLTRLFHSSWINLLPVEVLVGQCFYGSSKGQKKLYLNLGKKYPHCKILVKWKLYVGKLLNEYVWTVNVLFHVVVHENICHEDEIHNLGSFCLSRLRVVTCVQILFHLLWLSNDSDKDTQGVIPYRTNNYIALFL